MKIELSGVKFFIDSGNTITVIYEKNLNKFEDILKKLTENGLKILDISTDDGDLEDVFIKLTNN